jgi:hypothetical protein
MDQELPATFKNKLSLIFRVEPGCLGPDGAEHIDGFCDFAKSASDNIATGFLHCSIVPRNDKSLAETEYRFNGKVLNEEQLGQYFEAIGKDLDEFDEYLQDTLAELIDTYLGR